MTCWIAVIGAEKWGTFREKQMLAFAERHRDTVSKTEIGDTVFFLDEDPERSLLGAAEVASDPYMNRIPLFENENEVYPLRIKIRPITAMDVRTPLPIEIRSRMPDSGVPIHAIIEDEIEQIFLDRLGAP
ncbi:EVE domain-containing protein [Methanofollis fontis]|uniref:EVE domain-containing protein n=1 Tax=Methanofollis fontis TaxID=2052832 RepID=A0A483CMS6_9EURY|nr:hypothetical protein [Methanofollis fontis]TAJ43922.1 hypothetical protein CUJ86_07650 [Methanofollis fontis]